MYRSYELFLAGAPAHRFRNRQGVQGFMDDFRQQIDGQGDSAEAASQNLPNNAGQDVMSAWKRKKRKPSKVLNKR